MLTYFKFSNPFTVVLLVAVAFVLYRRRLYRDLPWFTAYIFYTAAYTTINYSITMIVGGTRPVFYTFWIGNFISVFFSFMVILEVFRHCVRGHDSIRNIGVTVLVVIALIALVIAIMMAPYGFRFEDNTALRQMARALSVLQRSVRLIQVGLLVGIFAFSSYLALNWRNRIFGIALGYGLYASVNLASSIAYEYFSARKSFDGVNYVTLVDGSAYKLTLILWMTYLWRPDHAQPSPLPQSSDSAELENWNEALKPFGK